MADSKKKTALVTGSSRGIGAAVAARLGADGFQVIVNYSGNPAPADALVRSIEEKGGRARAIKADVSDSDAVRRMFDEAEQVFGPVDVLVNNAGVMLLGNLADVDDATFDRQVSINLKGTF